MRHWHNIRPILTLVAFLALWWLTPPVIKRFSRDIFYEFQAPALNLQSHLEDLQTYWSMRARPSTELIEAGRDLARLNAMLEVRIQETTDVRSELQRLERMLNLPPANEFRYEVARVAERSASAWWQQIIIAKGKDYGIPVGAAVVYSGGVVGRIKSVHEHTSVVELVSSPGFRMAANIKGDSEPITYTGLISPPFSPARGMALNVPPSARASANSPLTLVSSPLGGIFPAGLTIGEITRLEPGHDGYFQQGIVRLDNRLNRIREVSVIVPLTAQARAALSPSRSGEAAQMPSANQ